MNLTLAELQSLSVEQLRAMNTMIVNEINSRGKQQLNELEVGMLVKINHKKIQSYRQFVVFQINRTKAVLEDIADGRKYTVSPSLVERIIK